MATSTKWRINVTANNGYAGNLGISEIQMRTAVGVPLLFSGGTATASSEDGSYTAGKAADDNLNTNWYGVGDTGWWQYEFASTIEVAAYAFASVDSDNVTTPKDFTLEYWDGSAWQVADTQTSQTGWPASGWQIREYTVGTPGYTVLATMHDAPEPSGASKTSWRLNISDNQGSTYNSIREVQFRTAAGASLPFSGGTAYASTEYGAGFEASKAADANPATYWFSAYDAYPPADWWRYDYASAIEIVAYTITASTPVNHAPKSWTLEYWDGAGWIVVDARNDVAAWTEGEEREYVVAANEITFLPLTLSGAATAETYIDLPLLTLSGAATAETDIDLPLFSLDGASEAVPLVLPADGNLTLPKLQLGGSLEPALPLPLLAAAGAMIAGRVLDGAATLQRLALSGSLEAPLRLPQLAVAGFGIANDAPLALPELTVAASGLAGATLDGAIVLLGATANATLLAGLRGDGAITLPLLTAEGGPEGAAFLPPLTAAADGLAGTIAVGAITLLRLSVAADTRPDNDIQLPLLSVDGAALQGAVAGGDLTLPLLGVAAGPEGAIMLPAWMLAAAGVNGNLGAGSLLFDKITLDATAGPAQGLADGDAVLSLAVSDALLLAGTISAGAVLLTRITLDASAIAGSMAGGALALQPFGVDGSAYASGSGAGAALLLEWTVNGSGDAAGVAAGAVLFSALTSDGTGAAGTISGGVVTLPLLRLSADGYADTVGTADLLLPVLSADGWLLSALAAPLFAGVAINTRTKAAATYSGLACNSIAQFNGVLLAATASGIVALIGDTDAGVPIDALVAGGVSDLKSTQFKRVLAGYVGYSAAGNLEMTMITDEHHEYIYQLEPRRVGEVHASRVKFGRGVDGRYWQWKLANQAGADFAIDSIALDATVLGRRV